MKNIIKCGLFCVTALVVLFFNVSELSAWVRMDGVLDRVSEKKRMEVEDVLKWKRITEKAISPDGKYVAVVIEPWKGISVVNLYDNEGEMLFSVDSSSSIDFDNYSSFVAFKKMNKESEEKVYTLGVVPFSELGGVSEVQYVEKVRSHFLPDEAEGTIFVHKKDSSLLVMKVGERVWEMPYKASLYEVSEDGETVAVSSDGVVLKYYLGENCLSPVADTLWRGNREVKRLTINEDGSLVSFLVEDELFVNNTIEEGAKSVAKGVSDKHEIVFSPDGSKLYFSFKAAVPERDSSIKDEDFPEVHVWCWNEDIQFTEQVVNEKEMRDAGELAVYHMEKSSVFKIENESATRTLLVNKGDSPLVVVLSDREYTLEKMWTGRTKYDVYIVDTYLERALFALKGIDGNPGVSPAGKYLYWYSAPDSSWVTYSLETKERRVITPPSLLPVYDVDNDVPDWPSSYSAAGWSEGDDAFLVYDKYDIWSVDPKGEKDPVNITLDGVESNVTYRYVRPNEEKESIEMRQDWLLTGFNNTTKGFGYYRLKKPGLFKKPRSGPEVLYAGDFMLGTPVKAARSDEWIFTEETFCEFPDVHYANKDFSKRVKITDANPQQQDYVWGTAELVSWISYDGKRLEGVLYKPEDYDSSVKYPVIVNFYEKNSHKLHSYRTPEAHRSTIDYHLYNSHGYIVFNPDVSYKNGYPGESAYNSVMPGISMLIEAGIADPERIGAQGHSWGGYQVAYLATRTPLFAAIESGAPVVNMFSAYGGIRWGSGKNRSFQYEHQQSRIGKTPWESPLRYMENSPVFTMDKVQTPILIMHNDNDGHVPWYQGIEFFVALKRLQKPVWLLNYTGEVHWPQKLKNKVDFQIRMKQFFDHYLKGTKAPEWMDPGLSLIELKARTGY